MADMGDPMSEMNILDSRRALRAIGDKLPHEEVMMEHMLEEEDRKTQMTHEEIMAEHRAAEEAFRVEEERIMLTVTMV